MASTTAEPNDDDDDVEEVNCPEHLIESADAKLNDEDIEGVGRALADVNQAIKLDPSVAKAYLLKGAIHCMIEEYDEAKETLEIEISVAPKQCRSFFKRWIDKCNIEEKKDASLNPPVEKAPENDGPVEQDDNASGASEPSPMMNSTSAKPKFRHEQYEKLEEVVIDIFAKSIPAESVSVQFSEEILVVWELKSLVKTHMT